MTTPNPLSVITEKLKLLNHEIEELKIDFCKLNTDDDRKSYYAQVKSIRSSETNYDKFNNKPSNRPTNLKDKFEQCLKESGERQEIQNKWMKKIMISTDLSFKSHDSSIKRLEQKVKKLILKENKETTTAHDKPKQQLQKVVSHEIKELLGSFILPCIVGNHPISNALADL
ncbi:hypothetical protein Tco_1269410 [Tanacetum coccineum]